MGQLTPNERALLLISCGAALVAIVAGWAYPNPGTHILKDILVFGSGGGIAYVLARVGARATTTERVRSLCNRSVQRLGLLASQIRSGSTILRANLNQAAVESVAFLLDTLADQAQVSIGDLEEMAGGKIGLDESVSAALYKIKIVTEEVREPSELKKEISAIIEQLTASTSAKQLATPVDFKCPQCGKPLASILGQPAGSTTHAFCPECGARVIVHRTREGGVLSKVLSRPPDTPSALRTAHPLAGAGAGMISCPRCKATISYNISDQTQKTIVRNCFRCDERIYIDVEKGTIHHSDRGKPLLTYYTTDGAMATIICPSCMNEIRVPLRPHDGIVKVSCAKCTSLIHATLQSPTTPTTSEHVRPQEETAT